MFKTFSESKKENLNHSGRSYCAETMQLEGDLRSSGSMDIAGLVNGNVFVNEITLNKGRHIRTINIIEYDINNEQKFNKHWHTHQDNMSNTNVLSMFKKTKRNFGKI